MEAVLARQIKTFRKEFRRQHGRDPSRKDMAKEPEVIVAYDAWLSLKDASSSSARASGSKSRPERSEGRQKPQAPLSPHQSLSQSSNMPPPVAPVTPRKKGGQAAIEDPTDEIRRSIHDSGGSVVDVPVTPVHRQAQQRSRQSLTASPSSPSMNAMHGQAFDDATSPSKLRTLIASFSSTRGRLTPTKKPSFASDERLTEQLEQSARAQNGNLFTPRTKARKRLRGEIVVTPVKEKEHRSGVGRVGGGYPAAESGASSASLSAKTTTAANRPTKRQRGMGTLRDFNFVPTSSKASQSALAPDLTQLKGERHAEGQYADDEADDEDEDMLGPSPSVRKIVNVQPLDGGGSFRPLFGSHVAGSLEDMDEEDASIQDMDTGEASVLPSSQPAESSTAITTPAPDEDEGAALAGSDEEAIGSIRAHDRRRNNVRRFQQLDEEDEDFLFGGDAFLMMQRGDRAIDADRTSERGLQSSTGDDSYGLMLDGLKIASPQGKRAERARRRLCAQNVRQLLQQVEHGTMSELVQYIGKDDDDSNVSRADEEHSSGKASAEAEKPIAHGNAKTARMMRGALTKAGRKALALAEHAAEQQPSVRQGQDAARKPQNPPLPKMILRRGRDDDDDDELEAKLYSDDDDGDEGDRRNRAASYAGDEDDCWASDVGSDEYGLGDGYMDEVDVE